MVSGNASVLVVDGSLETLLTVGSALEAVGYDAVGTSDPEEAKLLVEQEARSAIVLGAALPRMSGYELLAELRAIPAGTFLPVLWLATQADLEQQVRELGPGIDDCLLLPFAPSELVWRLARLVERRRRLHSGFGGGLESFPLSDLLQGVALGRCSGELEVAGNGVAGRLRFRAGQLISARADGRHHADAVERLLELEGGEFLFRQAGEDEGMTREPGMALQRLLLDSAWLADELRRRQRLLPAGDQPIVLTGRPLPPESDPMQLLPLTEILAEVDRAGVVTLDRVLELGLASRRRARLAVAWLVEHGLLAEAAPGLAAPPPRKISLAS